MEFQAKARATLGSLASEFNLQLAQKDEITFYLIGQEIEVHLYIYPSHAPSVNITLMPCGVQWAKWRQESKWGATGIWLAHLAAFRNAKAPYPDTHFQTGLELADHIDNLIQTLRNVGSDLLLGNTTVLRPLAAYVDDIVQSKLASSPDAAKRNPGQQDQDQ